MTAFERTRFGVVHCPFLSPRFLGDKWTHRRQEEDRDIRAHLLLLCVRSMQEAELTAARMKEEGSSEELLYDDNKTNDTHLSKLPPLPHSPPLSWAGLMIVSFLREPPDVVCCCGSMGFRREPEVVNSFVCTFLSSLAFKMARTQCFVAISV